MTTPEPTGPTIATIVCGYLHTYPVNEKSPDAARARAVAALADTVLATFDGICADQISALPDRRDPTWYVGVDYHLAVAAYRLQQVLTTVRDAMYLHERGSIMSAWPVLRSAVQMHDHLQLFGHNPTPRTHLQQAHAAIEAWNTLGGVSWDYGHPLTGVAFGHLRAVPRQPPVTPPRPLREGLSECARTTLDAASAVAVVNLGRAELGADRISLHPDPNCETAELTLADLQVALAVDIIESAAITAAKVLLGGCTADEPLRADVFRRGGRRPSSSQRPQRAVAAGLEGPVRSDDATASIVRDPRSTRNTREPASTRRTEPQDHSRCTGDASR